MGHPGSKVLTLALILDREQKTPELKILERLVAWNLLGESCKKEEVVNRSEAARSRETKTCSLGLTPAPHERVRGTGESGEGEVRGYRQVF